MFPEVLRASGPLHIVSFMLRQPETHTGKEFPDMEYCRKVVSLYKNKEQG